MVNQAFQQSKDWVLKNKFATFLAVALFAMVITTIALAVSNNNNADDLDVCRAAVDAIERGSTIPPVSDTTLTDDSTVSESDTTTVSMETSPITTLEPTTTVTTTTVVDPDSGVNYRLPGDNIPLHYDLHLHPDLATGKFTGRTTITIWTVHATDRIVLHSALLDIGMVQYRCLNDTSLVMRTQTVDTTRDFLIVELMRDVQPNQMSELTVDFSGELEGPIVGFYSSSYPTEDGGTKTIATSKFEPTFARQAFPCFDEPQLKAEYTIELVHPSGDGYHALSNMNALETVPDSPAAGLSTTKFARSVPMSTYLVVFIVSDFLSESMLVTPPTGLGQQFELSVYATPYQKANTAYALSTAVKVIQHYIEYFGIEYPLPKLDMAAIPDFVSGAMETWGLVTYRETSILYNEQTSSTANKQRVASVIAHELAHMWFGNLVTMKWWNELWLNEGFASYIEYKGIHAAHPEWEVIEQFVIDDLHGVLNLDATLASHPIVVSVENPNQITEIFDTITYSKGASVLRMLEDFVSEPIFRQGVRQYLEKLKFGNGVSEDLMEELDALYTEVSPSEVMDTFTKQKGFPVITVERRSQQYVLRQGRFLADSSAEETEESPYGYRWYVPVTYITSDDPNTVRRIWFPPTAEAVTINVDSVGDHWFKFNRNQVGYYRVNYPLDMWQEFSAALLGDVDVFSIGDRTGLLSDVFALADASTIDYSVALELTRFLGNERQYVPWSTAASKLKSIRNLLYNFNSYDELTKYIQDLLGNAVTELGWEVNVQEHMKNLLRTTILDLACSVGHTGCVEEAGTRFRAWLDSNEEVHPDIRSIVYTFGIQATGITVADWEKVLERFKSEIDANEKTKLMVALASYPDQRVMRRFLDISWDSAVIREQDQISCVQYIAGNRHGEQAAWEHVRENWDRFVARFTLNERNLGRMIPSITGRFTTTARLMELQDFFARNPDAGAGESARRQAIENIQNNISWLQRNEGNVAKWLQDVLEPASS